MSRREHERDLGDTYRGFGDALSRALELALTPTIFGGLGWLIDRGVGTSPLFTLVMFLLAVVGMFARMWYGYDTRMRAHEASAPWARTNR